MKKKKKRLIIVFSIIGFFLVIFLGSVEYTSHSKFCSTCHYMKPFYQSWKTSSHSHIECSTCHYPPGIRSKLRAKMEGLLQVGRYWTKLYLKSKPWAEIPDESCLREGCHEKRLLEGKDRFKKVVFDHKIHFTDLRRGKRLRCTSCHSQIVQGEHITVTESTCFICHFKESEHYPRIADCSHCHDKKDLISEETSRFNYTLVFDSGFSCDKCHSHIITGDGEVPRENCYKCHWERDRLEKYDDTDLMHSTHITSHKIECNLCHMEIQHKIVRDIEAIAACQTCHTDSHKSQRILFLGQGGKGIPHPMPNIMLEKGLSCKGCHIFHEEKGGKIIKSKTFVSKAEACESCHGKGFARILKDWEIATEKKLSAIKNIYENASAQVEKSRHKSKNTALDLLEEAAFNIDLVERGKSVHNMAYSQALLSASYERMREALRVIQSSYRLEGFIAYTEKIPTQCSNCHAGIDEISIEIFGLRFPHKNHLIEQDLTCSLCHSNVRKHGELTATKKSCAACHHEEPRNCAGCHQLQASFYQGGSLAGQEIPRDIMAEAEVGCGDCHLNSENKVFRSDKNKCLDCHEEEYGEFFTDWQSTILRFVKEIKTSLQELRGRKLSLQEREQILRVEKILEKIELDGSSGIHNFSYLEEILSKAKKSLQSLSVE